MELTKVEDKEIAALVEKEVAHKLPYVTDGEFEKTFNWIKGRIDKKTKSWNDEELGVLSMTVLLLIIVLAGCQKDQTQQSRRRKK